MLCLLLSGWPGCCLALLLHFPFASSCSKRVACDRIDRTTSVGNQVGVGLVGGGGGSGEGGGGGGGRGGEGKYQGAHIGHT